MNQPVTQIEIDQRVYDLYDEYCHGKIDRREYLKRAGALAALGIPALAMATSLIPQYAKAQTISFTDARIKASYVTYPSPGGNGDGKDMRGYLVQPAGNGPFPAVLIIHENRGLNPYIEDVARRAAVAGYLALAPDGLAPLGGYPGNDDDGRTLQAKLDQAKLRTDMLNGAKWLLLGRRHQQLSCRRDGRGSAGLGSVLRRGGRDRKGAGHQGCNAHPLRRQ
jgi:carboxymethylenebutenolidase